MTLTEARSQKLEASPLPESAPPRQLPAQRPSIGRQCLVRDRKFNSRTFVGARVIDCVAGENRAKRIRLLTGENAGEVLMPGEYDIMEFTD